MLAKYPLLGTRTIMPYGIAFDLNLSTVGWCIWKLHSWVIFIDFDHPRQGFDIVKDPVLHDIRLVVGFLNGLALLLRIQYEGLAWFAVPCQSFTCMSYHQHRRTIFNPYGCCEFPFVVAGNEMCTRSCLLILVAIARSVTWFIENPLRSAIHTWPFLNHLMAMPWLNSTRSSW